jgi:hypothetical protein
LREGHSENVLKIVKEVFELDDANAVLFVKARIN